MSLQSFFNPSKNKPETAAISGFHLKLLQNFAPQHAPLETSRSHTITKTTTIEATATRTQDQTQTQTQSATAHISDSSMNGGNTKKTSKERSKKAADSSVIAIRTDDSVNREYSETDKETRRERPSEEENIILDSEDSVGPYDAIKYAVPPADSDPMTGTRLAFRSDEGPPRVVHVALQVLFLNTIVSS